MAERIREAYYGDRSQSRRSERERYKGTELTGTEKTDGANGITRRNGATETNPYASVQSPFLLCPLRSLSTPRAVRSRRSPRGCAGRSPDDPCGSPIRGRPCS